MAENSNLERNEPPSQRRLDRATEKAQVARSRELSASAILLAGGAMLRATALVSDGNAVGAVLTGMGQNGAAAMLGMRDAYNFAQDAANSVTILSANHLKYGWGWNSERQL